MLRLLDSLNDLLSRTPHALIGLLGRLSIAWIFWTDGRARLNGGWNLLDPRPGTMGMFRGGYDLAFVPVELAAIAVQVAEHVLPLLLAFGLASRLSALGLLVLIVVLEIFVRPGPYALHGLGAAVLLMIIKYGPGSISLDEMPARR